MATTAVRYHLNGTASRTFRILNKFLLKSKQGNVPITDLNLHLKIHGDKMDLRNMRTPYNNRSRSFDVKDLVAREPIGQFKAWFEELCKSDKSVEPNAVCLSTCTKSGVPSSRMVLMKGFGKEGFKFYTNYSSRKGLEMQENPNAALLFYWEHPKRQVRIEGKVIRIPSEDSDEYFHSRPRDSQIAAAVSPQSQVVIKRNLDDDYEAMKSKYSDSKDEIPRPKHWGGIMVIPEVVEFWQGQSDRLHDRLRFRKQNDGEKIDNIKLFEGKDGWVIERLAP
ncbi:hypothetical protein CHUAL_003208 [Chamberlinius hualienensis]